MVALHRLFGWPIETSKSQAAGMVNKFLGMMGDTSAASTLNRPPDAPLEVSFYPNDDRMGAILDIMDRHDPAVGGSGTLTPHEAEVLLGKLGFLLRGAHGSVGRGASQPIFVRKHESIWKTSWNDALTHSFVFFRKLFTRFPVLSWHLAPDQTPWLLVYTDACKNKRFGGLGVVIFDKSSNKRYVSSAVCPSDIEVSFERDGHIINQLELLAMFTVLLTFPDILRGRQVYWLVDNCSVLSACVHGYATKLDMAKMANSVRLAICSFGVRERFDWVPTGANIADTPSRVSKIADMITVEMTGWDLLQLPSEEAWTPMVFPTASDLNTYDACSHLVPHMRTRTYACQRS
jgi:hypothetical protein